MQSDLSFSIIISQYQKIRASMHMSKDEAKNATVDTDPSNNCHPSLIIHDIVKQDMVLDDPTYRPPQFHSLLHPPSIFSQPTQTPLLDSYLKIKIRDKPKQTLAQLQHKKQLFLNYAILYSNDKREHTLVKDSFLIDPPNQSRQEFPQFTFTKILPAQTLLIATIMPSKHCKCNFLVRNLRGEVVKYYPNVFSTKKEGKILKLIAQYKKPILIVNDYAESQSTFKALLSIFGASEYIYYSIKKVAVNHKTLTQIEQKLKDGVLRNKEQTLQIISTSMLKFQKSGLLKQIKAHIQQKQTEQRQFLQVLRGKCSQDNRYLAFDMMGVNLWRQYKLQSHFVSAKIIQMFNQKEAQIKQIMGDSQDPSVLQHIPKRMLKAQNCIQCLVDHPEVKKPKRTYLTCSRCSFEKQKPIYLCRLCLGKFHQDPNVQTFKRNQKRRRIKRLKKKVVKETEENHSPEVKIEDIPKSSQQTALSHKLAIMMDLDQATDEIFSKMDELILEKRLDAAKFYMNMLLNTVTAKKKKMECAEADKRLEFMIPQ